MSESDQDVAILDALRDVNDSIRALDDPASRVELYGIRSCVIMGCFLLLLILLQLTVILCLLILTT